MEAARSAGMTLSGYVRARGLNLRGVYEAIAQRRRRGIVPHPWPEQRFDVRTQDKSPVR